MIFDIILKLAAVFSVIAAVCLAFFGLILLSEATAGVGVISLAAVAGIIARILQAESNFQQTATRIERLESKLKPAPPTIAI